MKKSLKAIMLVAFTGVLAAGSAFAAAAAQAGEGEWSTSDGKKWYKFNAEGTEYASGGWYYIQDGEDIMCYYFDSDGYLLTSTAKDGSLIDASGRYTEGGSAVTYSADEVSYYVTTTFASASGSVSEDGVEQIDYIDPSVLAAQAAEAAAAESSSDGESSSSSSTLKSTAERAGIKSGGAYSEEDDPAYAKSDIDFTYSKIVNSTVSSSWANYKISLPGTPTQGSGDNSDWYYESEEIGLIVGLYYPVSKYGGSSLAEFIEGFIADERGFAPELKSGSVKNAGSVDLGGITWTKLTRQDPSPSGSTYNDECYLRIVNGLVQIIMIDYNGGGASWGSVPKSISTVY